MDDRRYLALTIDEIAYYQMNEHYHCLLNYRTPHTGPVVMAFRSTTIMRKWWDGRERLAELIADGNATVVNRDGSYYLPVPTM